MSGRALLLAWGWLSLLGCTSFPTIESNVCGNGVWEPGHGEACDSFVDDERQVCRPAGAVGECQYDCRVGSNGRTPECPEGHGCSADGICRRATGAYESAPSLLSTEATSWLSTADFDGDERVDLVSSEPLDQLAEGRFRVHYFGADHKSVETKTFPRIATRPVIRDVNDDGKDDFVFSNFRIGMVPGRADREWIPATFSSYQVPNSGLRVVGVSDDFVGDGPGLVALTTFGDESGAFVPDDLTKKLELRWAARAPVSELVGSPLAADVVQGIDSPCRELVLAFRGASSFSVIDLCQLSGDPRLPDIVWRDEPREQIVSLPAGSSIDAGPIAADVDGNGHLDVIVGVADRPYVAFGDGNGLQPLAALLEIEVRSMAKPLGMPLAAGDLSGDGIADYVLPDFIVVSALRSSGTGLTYSATFENRGASWTMAEVSDFNGNGFLDAVAAADGAPGLSFMNGTGSPYLIGASLPSEGSVRFTAAGDFDGDLITDVAYVESGSPTEGADFLSIAFGTRDTPPLRGKRVAQVSGVTQLGSYGDRGFDNLFVASNQVLGDVPFSTLTMFDSTADRLPFAPYALVTFSLDRRLPDAAATAVIVGSFGAKDSHDVIALGMEHSRSDWTQWFAPDIAGGQHPPRPLQGEHAAGVFPVNDEGEDEDVTLAVAGLAADLDRDGLDEVLWLMPEGPDGCALMTFGVSARTSTTEQKGVVHFDEPCRTPELVSIDLDEDQALDVLALVGDPRYVQVLLNDGSGGLSRDDGLVVPIPGDSDVRAFSVFPQLERRKGDEPAPPRLAVVTADTLYVAATERNGLLFQAVRPIAEVNDARWVVAFDPNGDLIADIAVADAEGIRLFEATLE
jgi:hypothetical protein